MTTPQALVVWLGLATAGPTQAQTPPDVVQELHGLRAQMAAMQSRMDQLEAGLKPPASGWGMTEDQVRQLNKTEVKTEGLDEALEAQGLKGLKISGWMDAVYLASQGQRRAGFQFLNSSEGGEFAFDNGVFGMASLDFRKDMEGGGRWRLTLVPNRGGAGVAIDGRSIVHEASLSLPLADLPLRAFAGQIPDWSGHESPEATLNKLVTHNLLFDFTLPAVYTGAGLEWQSGAWTTKAMLANVNASRHGAGERLPALAYRVDYYRDEFSGFGLAGLHGRVANFRALGEANPLTGQPYDSRDTPLHSLEVDAYHVRGNWTWTGQIGVGQQAGAAITADPRTGRLRTSRWWGLSGLVAYRWMPQLEAALRLDHLHNTAHGGGTLGYSFADGRNGLGPDPSGDPERGANRYAASLGLRYTVNAHLSLKLEYRLDSADRPVFVDALDGRARHHNHLAAAAAAMSF